LIAFLATLAGPSRAATITTDFPYYLQLDPIHLHIDTENWEWRTDLYFPDCFTVLDHTDNVAIADDGWVWVNSGQGNWIIDGNEHHLLDRFADLTILARMPGAWAVHWSNAEGSGTIGLYVYTGPEFVPANLINPYDYSTSAVPEPATAMLLLFGMLLIHWVRHHPLRPAGPLATRHHLRAGAVWGHRRGRAQR
jgi:hypothetical protein